MVGAVLVVDVLLESLGEFEVVASLVLDGDDREECGGRGKGVSIGLSLEPVLNNYNVRKLILPIATKLKKGLEGTTMGGDVAVADITVARASAK